MSLLDRIHRLLSGPNRDKAAVHVADTLVNGVEEAFLTFSRMDPAAMDDIVNRIGGGGEHVITEDASGPSRTVKLLAVAAFIAMKLGGDPSAVLAQSDRIGRSPEKGASDAGKVMLAALRTVDAKVSDAGQDRQASDMPSLIVSGRFSPRALPPVRLSTENNGPEMAVLKHMVKSPTTDAKGETKVVSMPVYRFIRFNKDYKNNPTIQNLGRYYEGVYRRKLDWSSAEMLAADMEKVQDASGDAKVSRKLSAMSSSDNGSETGGTNYVVTELRDANLLKVTYTADGKSGGLPFNFRFNKSDATIAIVSMENSLLAGGFYMMPTIEEVCPVASRELRRNMAFAVKVVMSAPEAAYRKEAGEQDMDTELYIYFSRGDKNKDGSFMDSRLISRSDYEKVKAAAAQSSL